MKQSPPKTAFVVLSCRVSELSAPKKHQPKKQKWRCGFYKKKKKRKVLPQGDLKSNWCEKRSCYNHQLGLVLIFFVCVCYLSVKTFKMRESCLKPQPSSPMMCRHWWDLCWLGSKKIINKDAVSAKADRKGENVKDGVADEQNGLKRNKTMKRLDEKEKLKEGGWVNWRGRLRR